jgi:hypothetical protein
VNRAKAVLWEPHRHGFTHARCNAAVAAALETAFGSATVLCAPEHGSFVRDALSTAQLGERSSSALRIQPYRLPKVAGHLPSRARVALELSAGWRQVQRMRPEVVVIGSITGNSIRFLQHNAGNVGPNWLAVVHQANDLVEPKTPSNVRLAEALRDADLPLALLSTTPTAQPDLVAIAPHLRSYSFLLPSLAAPVSTATTPQTVDFTLVGAVSAQEFERFASVAAKVIHDGIEATFSIAGFVKASSLPPTGPVSDVGLEPLDDKELHRRLARTRWAVNVRDSERYQTRLSGSIQDAISHGVPLISTRNAFVEFILRETQVESIGFTDLNSDDDMVECIRRICKDPSDRSTDADVHANLAAAAALFSIDSAASSLVDVLKKTTES